MNEMLSWPYDEVSVRFNRDSATASVTAPWLNATVEVTPDTSDGIRMLAEKLEQQVLTPADLALVNWFFKPLDKYPFCYTLPTKKEAPQLDRHEVIHPALAIGSIEGFLRSTINETGAPTGEVRESEVSMVVPKLGRSEWAWDWDAAAAFAKAGDKIHPESLLSVARRFHLLDLLGTCDSKKIFEIIAGLNAPDFARAAGLMVRQNHYVTQKCRESLLPAVEIAGSSRTLVEDFIRAESGHDRILRLAMQSFAKEPERVPVATHTKWLMHLLGIAARKNFLAFAMAIDFFERSSFAEADPLASLLKKGGFEKAATQINRHMKINDAGGHENVARGFLKQMAPCDPNYALEAIRVAEAISLFVLSIPHAAFELYETGEFVGHVMEQG